MRQGEEEEIAGEDKWVASLNAYLGAQPIAAALSRGAQIVITGRCVDSALALGPLIHEVYHKSSMFRCLPLAWM
jgi:hypothetical protein